MAGLLDRHLARLRIGVDALHLIDALRLRQPAVVGRLVADVEQEQQARREAQRQTEDVDERIGAALGESPEANRQIVTPHGLSPIRNAARGRSSGDRKSVVKGKSVSVRVDRGGCRMIKKKKNRENTYMKN